MPISHIRHGQNKSCLVGVGNVNCELNWRQVRTVGDRKFRNWTCLVFCNFVLSRNAVWTEFCFQFFCSRAWQNCSVSNISRTTENCLIAGSTKLFSLKYIDDYWKLSYRVSNSVQTVFSCPCRRCELNWRQFNETILSMSRSAMRT